MSSLNSIIMLLTGISALVWVKLIRAVWVRRKGRLQRAQGRGSGLDGLHPAWTRLLPDAFVS